MPCVLNMMALLALGFFPGLRDPGFLRAPE